LILDSGFWIVDSRPALRAEKNQVILPRACQVAPRKPVTAPFAPGISHLRRRLRGLPHSTLLRTLQQSLEELPVSALAADNTGRYVAVNAAALALTGYARDELLKMSVQDLTPEMRQDAAGLLWNRFIQAGTQAGDYVLVRKDGSPVPVHYAAYASVAPGVHVSLLTPTELPSGLSSAI
jgi:PAS domain S-box-containing protein